MMKILLPFAIAGVLVYGQVLNRVRVREHREYMVAVITETVMEVERREWCNLKIADMTQDVDEEILDLHLHGTIQYTNGFVVSIQHLDILQSSLNQIWTQVGEEVQVELRGQLRMTDLTLGLDAVAKFTDGDHHYTGAITHRLVTFDFSVFRNVHTHAMTVRVTGSHPATLNLMRFLPDDKISDAMSVLFVTNSTFYSVTGWGSQVFQPIALDVVTNKVPFPGLCYDCAT